MAHSDDQARLSNERGARLAEYRDRIAALEAELAEAQSAIEFDRTKLADAITAIDKAMDGRFWLTEGRGSYSWDDDRYRDEFHEAGVQIKAAIMGLRSVAANLKNSPKTTAEIAKARVDLRTELAEARKDGERLDWLLDVLSLTDVGDDVTDSKAMALAKQVMRKAAGLIATPRAAIDAARGAK